MRSRTLLFRSLAIASALGPLGASAQDDTVQTTVKTTTVEKAAAPAAVVAAPAAVAAPAVIDPRQIDRFAAIRELQADLRADPNDAADWVILGELAHEVALDLPSGNDVAYYTMSRESYENALRLEPTNPGLKAAVQFARDQEARVAQFDGARRRAATAYLAARRRELSAARVPTVRTVVRPVAPLDPAVVVAPAPAAGAAVVTTTTTDAPKVAVATAAPAATVAPVAAAATPVPGVGYQPFVSATGAPLTFDSYTQSYAVADPAAPAVTVRQSVQTFPPVNLNEAVRRASGVSPRSPR